MDTNIVALESNRSLEISALVEQAQDYARHAKADNTRRAYHADWNDFDAWCGTHRFATLPASPETVALYLSHLANTHKCSTLQRRISAISQVHAAKGLESPTKTALVRAVWQGIRRAKGVAPECKEPAVTPIIRRMVAQLPDNLLGTRDRALLLVGFAGGFRRSELVGLNRSDVVFTVEGATITLRRSKTDQEGEGRKIGIPYGSYGYTCPVRSLQAWLNATKPPTPESDPLQAPLYNVKETPLFAGVNRHGHVSPKRLSGNAVASVVKRYAEKAGLDATKFAGHSLRAGLATAAAKAGVSERAIMAQTGHKSVQMVRRYIRDGELFQENAAAEVGL
ncbi:MAG: site-specific integrase [Armatimonadetes bacterium]|nr:site-specific integrase [Armatimonadota bacterium]